MTVAMCVIMLTAMAMAMGGPFLTFAPAGRRLARTGLPSPRETSRGSHVNRWICDQRIDQTSVTALSAQGTVLARECEDFLSGSLAKDLILARGNVPDWAWLSVLAHASESELRNWAEDDYSQGLLSTYDTWRFAESSTACAVLSASETWCCSVEEIQRRLLVPLELQLATVDNMSPDFFKGKVYEALNS